MDSDSGGEKRLISVRARGGEINECRDVICNICMVGSSYWGCDYEKTTTRNMFCVNGIVEPDLKDPALLEHFNAATPKDLAAILFQAEAGTIADEIIALSGLKTEEKEIKN